MSYEVEQKYPVDNLAELGDRIAALGAVSIAAVTQIDLYFNHPGRDFSVTDEALRIRQVNGTNILTYKGPKLDATTKTRQEIELSVEPGPSGFAQATALLTALGFRKVAEVRKRREPFHFDCAGYSVELALDQVDEVGAYAELEISVPDQQHIEAAKKVLVGLAEKLGLKHSERRSYLELLLKRDG